MDYYSAIKKNIFESVLTRWMKLEPIIQSEVSQKEKHQYSMLLLSRFSRVRLCVAPETAAHQAPPSLGFSGKNTGVGCHFLLQCMKVKSEREVTQSCLTLCNPVNYSTPGLPVHHQLLEFTQTPVQ